MNSVPIDLDWVLPIVGIYALLAFMSYRVIMWAGNREQARNNTNVTVRFPAPLEPLDLDEARRRRRWSA
jgi:hypothetical protein